MIVAQWQRRNNPFLLQEYFFTNAKFTTNYFFYFK